MAWRSSVVRRAWIFVGCLLGITLLMLPLAVCVSGWPGGLAVVLSLGISLGTGLLSLGLLTGCDSPQAILQMNLCGMLVRMAVPLSVVMIVYLRGGLLAEAGLVYYILVYYFASLIAETTLAVGGFGGQHACPTASAADSHAVE
jgi:hypothetical protein